jgi:HupE / UreJ protein
VRRALAVVGLLLVPRLALAHSVGLSTATLSVDGREVNGELAFARPDLAPWLTGARIDARSAERLVGQMVVKSAGTRCPGSLESVRPLEQDGAALILRFHCARAPDTLSFELPLLETLGHGHRHLLTVRSGAEERRAVLHRGQPAVTFALSAGGGSGATFGHLLGLGVEHILTGLDHLVFLFGLLIVGGRPRALLRTVTAFTAGHSVTLACGALGLWSPGPRWVEPLIALSIAYVGVENLVGRQTERRWPIALAFGLVHGFGFSGALAALAIPRAEIVPALLAFNTGVEIGQLAVLAVLVPLLGLARRWALFSRYVVPALSGAIIVPGLVWFVMRVSAG